MPRTVVGGLIQMSNPLNDNGASVGKIKQAMIDKHVPLVEEAGKKGVQILCLEEAGKKSSAAPTSARRRTASGATRPSRSRAPRTS